MAESDPRTPQPFRDPLRNGFPLCAGSGCQRYKQETKMLGRCTADEGPIWSGWPCRPQILEDYSELCRLRAMENRILQWQAEFPLPPLDQQDALMWDVLHYLLTGEKRP